MSDEIMVRIPQRTVIDLMNVIMALNEENKKLRKENKKAKEQIKKARGNREKVQIPNCLGAYESTDLSCFSCQFCECCKEYVDLEGENYKITEKLKRKDKQIENLERERNKLAAEQNNMAAEINSQDEELEKKDKQIEELIRRSADLASRLHKTETEAKALKGESEAGIYKFECQDCLMKMHCYGNCYNESGKLTVKDMKDKRSCFGRFETKNATCIFCEYGILCKEYVNRSNEQS